MTGGTLSPAGPHDQRKARVRARGPGEPAAAHRTNTMTVRTNRGGHVNTDVRVRGRDGKLSDAHPDRGGIADHENP